MTSIARIEVPALYAPDSEPRNVDFLLRLIQHLSEIQHHVLGRVAVHTWRFNDELPYFPPNAHQAQAAWSLALPQVRLVHPSEHRRRPAYLLTRRGAIVVRRLFRVVNAVQDEVNEEEFSLMRYFVRNRPEVNDDD